MMRITDEQRADGFQPVLRQEGMGKVTEPVRAAGSCRSPRPCKVRQALRPGLGGDGGCRAECCAGTKGCGLEINQCESLHRQTANRGPCRAQPHRTLGQKIPKAR